MDTETGDAIDQAIRAMPVRFVEGGIGGLLLPSLRVGRGDLRGGVSIMPTTQRLRRALPGLLEAVAQPRFDPFDATTAFDRGPKAAARLADEMGDKEAILHFSPRALKALAAREGAAATAAIGILGAVAQKRGPGDPGRRHDPYQDALDLFDASAPTRKTLAAEALTNLERRTWPSGTSVAVPVAPDDLAAVAAPREKGGGDPPSLKQAIGRYASCVRQPIYDRDGRATGGLKHGDAGIAMLKATFGAGPHRKLWFDAEALATAAARHGTLGHLEMLCLGAQGAMIRHAGIAAATPDRRRRDALGIG